ncbi:MAG TPA: PilZ domain-containing protein [Thermodesulfovibrionales bacterium]|nr:PilZ domain-containing protein [Thermodesulfovibrionales bacterium]
MKKVIVAKDISAMLAKGKSFLNRAGIKTFTAASNEKALAFHRAVKADLIIAKLNTPEMSGETLCSLIRDDDELRNVSLLIVSSETEADLERCVQCRANAFISSPIDSEVLLQEAHKLLHVAPRAECRIPLRVKLYGKSKEKSFTGHTKNMSASGMLFGTEAALFEGDVITCSFDSPGFPQMSADAEIVRVVGKEAGEDISLYGIRFVNAGADFVGAIKTFVEKECAVQ